MASSLKEEFLELLEKDKEFRYAVAGYLGLSEILKRLDGMKESMIRLGEEQKRLREDFNKMLEIMDERFRRVDKRFERIEREIKYTRSRLESRLDKISLSVEDDARVIIEYHLKKRGIDIKLGGLVLPDMQVNIYGTSDNICVIGEVETRAGVSLLNELKRKYKQLREKYPEYLRKNVILVIYTLSPTYDSIEKAKKENIWLLRATTEFARLNL
ncbi:MAG: hypothetical protein ACTSYM_01575 [Candidatus Baldrarchaeia archaeon]